MIGSIMSSDVMKLTMVANGPQISRCFLHACCENDNLLKSYWGSSSRFIIYLFICLF